MDTKEKKLKDVDTVIWDLDWTLWSHENYQELLHLCNVFNMKCDLQMEGEFQELLECYSSFLSNKKVSNSAMAKAIEYYMPILKVYNVSGDAFLREWNKNNFQFEMEGAKDTLKALQEKGYRQVAFSDWLRDVQLPTLQKFGFDQYFEKVFTGDGSYMKPDIRAIERIFEYCSKEHCIFIGDSLSKDIGIASKAGIRSIWFNWRKQENSGANVPTFEVREENLREILNFL